jgi:Txe/YoeB family toxin of toxin-antitoxin system
LLVGNSVLRVSAKVDTKYPYWISSCINSIQQAQKDAKKLSEAGLRSKAETLLNILRKNPYQTPPNFEKLIGDLSGGYSRRINIQYRLVYQILEDEKVAKVIRMWIHHE